MTFSQSGTEESFDETERRGWKSWLQTQPSKKEDHGTGQMVSWQTVEETVETVRDFIFLDSKITVDGDCSHEIKRHLLLGRKAMTNLDSILKSRNITLLTKVHLVKAMVFPAVMHGCEFWTVRKNEVKCKVFSHVWLFAGQNTGVGSCSLLQGIFPT